MSRLRSLTGVTARITLSRTAIQPASSRDDVGQVTQVSPSSSGPPTNSTPSCGLATLDRILAQDQRDDHIRMGRLPFVEGLLDRLEQRSCLA